MSKPTLRLAPNVWAKLLYFKSLASSEYSGFGISHPKDPLYLIDFLTVKQECSSVTTEMDDNAIADFADAQLAAGRKFEDFMNIYMVFEG